MVSAALVDGACGFTGRPLVRECLVNGDYVVATDIFKEKEFIESDLILERALTEGRLIYLKSDLRDKQSLERLFLEAASTGFEIKEAYRIAALFDMSASYQRLHEVNVKGTINFCEVALQHGVERAVYNSTASIYGHHHPAKLIGEQTGFENTGDYPATKFGGEKVHACHNKNSNLKSLITRSGLKYGPGSVYGAIIFIAAAYHLKDIPSTGQARSTYLHIANDVAAMHHLMKKQELFKNNTDDPNQLAYNIADQLPSQGITQEEIIRFVHHYHFGSRPFWERLREAQTRIPKPKKLIKLFAGLNDQLTKHTAFPALLEPSSIDYYYSDHCFDTTKLAATGFQWPLPDTQDGLKRTLDWYVENNWPGLPDLTWLGLVNGLFRK